MTNEELLEVIEKAARDRSTHLNLLSRGLTVIPEEIGKLTNLISLEISYNQLTSLPVQIGKLTKLRKLYANKNKLVDLPGEIGQLRYLSILDLDSNNLTNLSTEIGNLNNLLTLHLRGNKLKSIPEEIGNLKMLDTLYLSNNQLNSLPAEIGQLSNLVRLFLDQNELNNLPDEIGKLTQLSILDLDSNFSLSLPPEIRGRGCQDIVSFYRQKLEQKTDRIYEAKLLIIGEGGAGKTTLANKIKSSDYQLQEEESTQGIDVTQWQFPLDNGKEFRINIWDFGGQEIYHTTHQFFLTKRSLYALVVDTRKEDTDFYY
jgi:internalin A